MKDKELNKLFADAIRNNWKSNAFSDYQGETFTYKEVGEYIMHMHEIFKQLELRKGDKISLFGNNSARWGMSFLAIVSYGAVVVPILPDFSTANVHHIINHSDSKLLFIGPQQLDKLEFDNMRAILGTLNINDLSLVHANKKDMDRDLENAANTSRRILAEPSRINFKAFDLNETCLISYTSGTTGFTKGVMLPRRSILSNIIFAQDNMPLQPGNKLVSFLPMAHSYGMLFEFLFPFTLGCHVTFLSRVPSPKIITTAFGEIKPHLILSVPLVIEKIYKKRILPKLEKPLMKVLKKLPVLSSVIEKKVHDKLSESFGGEFREVVIGGAPLSEEVEIFLKKIGFKYTIGYGMTECGPLISYAAWNVNKLRSAGKVVDRMQMKIHKENPEFEVGEIHVKGEHLMLGYYKNTEATKAAFTKDGWLKTGDLGYIDKDGFLFIKGRSKNLILGPSGQNIFPEELEARICNLPCVQECVVKERDGKLVAMIFPDCETMDEKNLKESDVREIMEKSRMMLNSELPRYEQISKFEIVDEEFRKTPKRNIKRYLYS